MILRSLSLVLLASLKMAALSLRVPSDRSFRLKAKQWKLQSSSKESLEPREALLTPNSDKGQPSSSFYDYALLSLVPVVWGTYSPLMSFIFRPSADNSLPSPPPLLFNAATFLVSYSLLSTVQVLRRSSPQPPNQTNSNLKGVSLATRIAGAELGLWLFLGSSSQLLALSQPSASPIKAAVLIQSTTLLVPILDVLLPSKEGGQSSSSSRPALFFSSILVAIGILILTLRDGSGDPTLSSLSSLSLESSDGLILLAAIFYSLHVVRLSALSPASNPLTLSRMKSLAELCLCSLAIGLSLIVSSASLEQYTSFLSSFARASSFASIWPLLGAVLWNGGAATALTNWAQSSGQQRVSATTANLIYSSQPLWSTAFAVLLLHESVDGRTACGAAVLLTGIYSAILAGDGKEEDVL